VTEFNAAGVWHGPVGDYQGGLVFGEQLNGLATILRH